MASATAPHRPRPLARLLRLLGFRLVFPVGTMPVPYHPAIPLLLLAAPVVWLAVSLVKALGRSALGEAQWPWMILAGLALGIPLSIPIVSWALRVFGAFLAQGLLFAFAMIALAADVYAGRAAPAWAVLPAGYVLAYAVQRIGGLVRVHRYRRINAAFTPVAAGSRTLVFSRASWPVAADALRQGLARRAFTEGADGGAGQGLELIEEADVAALRALGGKALPRGWRIEPAGERAILMRRADAPEGPPLTITLERFGRRSGYRAGLVRWRIAGETGELERISGTARIVGPIPLVVLFCAVSITGGRSEWIAGFAPHDIRIGDREAEDPANVLAPQELPAPRTEAERAALVEEMRAAFGADEAHDRAQAAKRADLIREREAAGLPTRLVMKHGVAEITGRIDPPLFWREVAADPRRWTAHRNTYLTIAAKAAECDREDLRRTLNWLQAAVEVRARDAIVAAARLLAAMEQPLLASDHPRLMGLFNSRVLGMVWALTPDFDVRPLPPRVPRFGEEAGFGLIRSVPELYRKLADLSPEMEDMVTLLVEEALRYQVSLPPELAQLARPPAATG